MAEPRPSLRVVPGAPPELTKSQQKRRRGKAKGGPSVPISPATPAPVPDTAAAAQLETAPDAASVAPALVAPEPPATPGIPAGERKSSVWELVNRRAKALAKKIARYEGYDPENLNEDQRQSIQTLPALRAVYQELQEVKKAIDADEAEQAAEVAAALRRVVAEAVAEAEAVSMARVLELLTLIRIGAMPPPDSNDAERAAIADIAEALVAEDLERQRAAAHGFFRTEGEHAGVPHVRLQEIARTQLLPAVAIDIVVDEEPEAEVEHQTGIAIADGDDGVPAVQIPGAPPSVGGAFLFVQESELEGAEEPEPVVAVVETIEVTDDGTVVVEALDVLDEPQGTLDWADEGLGGLPSITAIQAALGTPDTATPPDGGWSDDRMNIPEPAPVADDGFQTPPGRGRGGRGRGGRGRGDGSFRGDFRGGRGRGFRGADRGAFRGGERGGFQGGERGGFQGGERGGFQGAERGGAEGGERGAHRGAHRGDRGAFRGERGGERGAFRGAERGGDRGSFRGAERGRGDGGGEYRGRSDGEWRTGGPLRGGRGRGGPPPAAPPATTAA